MEPTPRAEALAEPVKAAIESVQRLTEREPQSSRNHDRNHVMLG
jgi:hypothetical protein